MSNFDPIAAMLTPATSPLGMARETICPAPSEVGAGLAAAIEDLAGPAGTAAPCGCHPAHLYPPLGARPFLLRSSWKANWGTAPAMVLGAGPGQIVRARMLDWFVPRGQRYTTTRGHFNLFASYSEACVGAIISRNDKEWLNLDEITTDHGNGITSRLNRAGHVAIYHSRDSINDASNHYLPFEFPSTFEPGEKISIDAVFHWVGTAAVSLNVVINGYLYANDPAAG